MMNDPLSILCVGRLTRLLELSSLEDLKILEDCSYVSQNVELEDHNLCSSSYLTNKNVKNNQVKNLFKFLSRKETPHVFGQQISVNTVEFIIQLIEYLKINAGIEGLFRISGNKKRQEELKQILNKGGKLNLFTDDVSYNPHDIAGILKQFFGELPEPLLTKQLYDCYQQLAGKLKEMDSCSARNRKIDTLKFLFLLLPPLNRLLLKKLVELLAVVAADNINRMTAYNLGVVFAPTIVCTRQSMDRLTELTDYVEPFTDLVKFIIENADEVFQIPQEFLTEAKEYLLKIALDKENDAEVPMLKSCCQQIDAKEYRREAKDNTHESLMQLYSQMMDMPDGPLKKDFMEKFQQSYPGTPLFIPKSVKKTQTVSTSSDKSDLKCPATPEMILKFKMNATKHLAKNSCNVPIPLTPVAETKKGAENMSTPSTPGQKMKQCLKRIRRRSVDIFKPKQSKPATPEPNRKRISTTPSLNRKSMTSKVSASSIRSRAHSIFRSNRLQSDNAVLKKSISTPILTTLKHGNLENRKLSLGSDTGLNVGVEFRTDLDELRKEKDRPISFTFGDQHKVSFVNLAFQDTPEKSSNTVTKISTPVIRKNLCPDTKKKLQAPNDHAPRTALLKEINDFKPSWTPKIMNHRIAKTIDKPKLIHPTENKLESFREDYEKFDRKDCILFVQQLTGKDTINDDKKLVVEKDCVYSGQTINGIDNENAVQKLDGSNCAGTIGNLNDKGSVKTVQNLNGADWADTIHQMSGKDTMNYSAQVESIPEQPKNNLLPLINSPSIVGLNQPLSDISNMNLKKFSSLSLKGDTSRQNVRNPQNCCSSLKDEIVNQKNKLRSVENCLVMNDSVKDQQEKRINTTGAGNHKWSDGSTGDRGKFIKSFQTDYISKVSAGTKEDNNVYFATFDDIIKVYATGKI